MTIANCPRCAEQVSIPDSASRDAIVRCPLCQDEYTLADALAQVPPSLIVVSDFGQTPETDAEEDDASWSALNLSDDDTDEVGLAAMETASPAAPFAFNTGSAAVGGKSKAAIRPSTRARKPKGSPIKSVLSIVIGGLMAFPIAQLILWYLPGEWKRDFGVGPVVAQYVPAIVPAKFRGDKMNSKEKAEFEMQDSGSVIPDFNMGESEFTGAGANQSSLMKTRPEPSSTAGQFVGGGKSDEDASANKQATGSKKKQKKTDAVIHSEDSAVEDAMSEDEAAAVGADLFASPVEVPEFELDALPSIDPPNSPNEVPSAIAKTTDTTPSLDSPARDDAAPATDASPSEAATLAPGNIRNAPQVTTDDVAKSVQMANSGNQAWDANEASTPSGTIKREFYLSFSKLGEALTFADRSDDEVATQIAETAKLLEAIGTQPAKLDVIGGVANGWIAAGHEKRTTDGICVYGVVQAVEPIGELFETTIDSGGQQIVVVSTTDPSEHFKTDRQVLVLGTILDQPAKNLGGYEGSRDVVVLDGYHVVVSTE